MKLLGKLPHFALTTSGLSALDRITACSPGDGRSHSGRVAVIRGNNLIFHHICYASMGYASLTSVRLVRKSPRVVSRSSADGRSDQQRCACQCLDARLKLSQLPFPRRTFAHFPASYSPPRGAFRCPYTHRTPPALTVGRHGSGRNVPSSIKRCLGTSSSGVVSPACVSSLSFHNLQCSTGPRLGTQATIYGLVPRDHHGTYHSSQWGGT